MLDRQWTDGCGLSSQVVARQLDRMCKMSLTVWCQERLTVLGAGAGILAAALVISPGGAMAKDVFPFPVTTRTLDNGLRVVMVPFDSPGIVAYYTIVRAGSRNE